MSENNRRSLYSSIPRLKKNLGTNNVRYMPNTKLEGEKPIQPGTVQSEREERSWYFMEPKAEDHESSAKMILGILYGQ